MMNTQEEREKKVKEAQRIIFNVDTLGSVAYWHNLATYEEIKKGTL
jgi:hypothetical protein